MRILNRSSKIRPERRDSRQSRWTRSLSSGWIESSQPPSRNSSSVCPVIHRHSGESSSITPSGEATQTTWAPPCASARYRSSLRRSAASDESPVALSVTVPFAGAAATASATMRPAPICAPSGPCTGNQ